MFDALHIHEPRERVLVGLADMALWPLGVMPHHASGPVGRNPRVLLLRLERIGDLLMVIDAIRLLRAWLPEATIDLAVGSWNAPLAAVIAEVSRVEVVDAPWLARGGQASWTALLGRARRWRGAYDLVINFEPDIRSNLIAWLTRAPRRVGYWTGGGGALLTDAIAYEPTRHVADNARGLIARAIGRSASDGPIVSGPWRRLPLPDAPRTRARAIVGAAARPLIGVHASGGRESKQWHLDRFAATARAVAAARGGTIILTGASADRAMVDRVKADLTGVAVIDAAGDLDILSLAALLGEIDLFISSDTGPMHLAAAMGTPVVSLFGPSDPRRYGPLAAHQEVITIDLWCRPCGQVRLPPERCRSRVPECLDGITVDRVTAASLALLDRVSAQRNR